MLDAERFATRVGNEDVARELRSVKRWPRAALRTGGPEALASEAPASYPKLSPVQLARLEQALPEGPVVHGWAH